MELWRARESQRDNPVFQRVFADAWRMGQAHAWVLDTGQQEWIERRNKTQDFCVWMIARQRGKSFAALFDDLMFGTRTEGAIVRYLGQTGDSALAILGPTMDQIMAICPLPRAERPYPYNKNDSLGSSSEFRWGNGASLVWSGTDNDTFRRQRGPRSHRITYDEAGFYPKLTEVQEALNPSLQTTGGAPLYLSTPPISPGHPFVDLYEAASAIGRSEHETLYDNPRLTPEQCEGVIARAAAEKLQAVEKFKKSTYFRREYLAEICLDSELAVVPEFPEVKEAICVSRPRAPFFDLCISLDPGMDDFSGVLFAVTDFRRNKLVIEHELLLQKANTGTIAAEVLGVLETHYGAKVIEKRIDAANTIRQLDPNSERKPHWFVVDDPHKRISADLWNYHHLSAAPAMKDDSEAAINVMRLEVGGKNIEIDPRCTNLIRQLGNAVRVKPGGDMTRSKRDGHWDLIAALKYLVRHWDKTRNPYPAGYGFDSQHQTRREVPPPVTLSQVLLRGTSLGRRR